MKVKVKKNALDLFIQDNSGHVDDYWEQVFEKISGKTLEVDTNMLFKYEYNLKPKKNILKESIRIFDGYVEKVIDDERKGKAYCSFCEHVSSTLDKCSFCGRSDCLEPFDDEEDYY